jgi:hypothetical protein
MKIKITIFIFSIIYCAYLVTLLIASYYKSTTLNPLNSEYCFQRGLLIKAIELEPSKADYHIYYGLVLLKTLPKDKFSVHAQLHLAKQEFSRAIKLKPYSESYKKTYDTYVAWINEQ